MKYLTGSIATLTLVAAFAISAFAQPGGRGGPLSVEDTLRLYTPDGKVTETKLTDDRIKKMLANGAMPVTQGGMIMMIHGGKMYMVQDKKMPDGKMLSDKMME
jgi:hypothetical protein